MHLVRKTRRITLLVGAGAVAAYFLDPDNGAARREHLLDQFKELTRRNELFGNRDGVGPFRSPATEKADDDSITLPPLDEPISPQSGDNDSEPRLGAEAFSGQHSRSV